MTHHSDNNNNRSIRNETPCASGVFTTAIAEIERIRIKSEHSDTETKPESAPKRRLRIEEHLEARPPFCTYRAARIRLKGQWLERAGFLPGAQVEVRIKSAGLIELQAINPESV